MAFVEICDLFTYYGVDVAVLAAVTCALTQVLKTTVLKNAQKKLYTFLPYILGVALYAAYAAVTRLDISFLAKNFALVLSKGVSAGALATVIYSAYCSLKKGGGTSKEEVIADMLCGYVPEGQEAEAAAKIAALPEEEDIGLRANQIADIILGYAQNIPRGESEVLARLIIKTVSRLK